MKKKLLSLLLCLVLVAASVCVLVACTGDNSGPSDYVDENGVRHYYITVWASEGSENLMRSQIDAFNTSVGEQNKVVFHATVETVSESKAVGDMEGKPRNTWADIYCFAQDQLARAVSKNLLHELNSTSTGFIGEHNDEAAIEAVSIGGLMRAFPMTADNGYFMYYDTRVINEDHLGSLNDLIADCQAADKKFSMLLNQDAAWYAASFFYATGCVSEWETNDNGTFKSYNDTIEGDKAVKALQGMQLLLKSSVHNNSDKAADFDAGRGSAVVISGVWEYNAAVSALGSNLGIAPLPSFKVEGDDTSYQLRSFLGYKLMGISPQTNAVRSAFLQILAQYLTGTACQQQRFEQLKWGPADKSLSELENDALTALKVTANIKQGQYPDKWWTAIDQMTLSAKNSASDAATLGAIITTYRNGLAKYLS